MANDAFSAPVFEQLAIVTEVDRGTAEALTSVAQGLDPAEETAEVERLREVVRNHIAVLAALGVDVDKPLEVAVPAGRGGPLMQAISAAEHGFAAAMEGYADLHATARVLYEPDLCDLAERHLADAIGGLRVMAALKTAALVRDLNAEGLYCRCVCPSCSIGACLCIRSSIASVASVNGWPAPPESEGVELRSPPRPGSQLAAAGIHERDRLLSVDGIVVHSNGELQAALRRHPFGETAQLSVARSTGEVVAVPVKRVDGSESL